MLGQHLLREGLGLKKSNTERAIKIAAIKLAIIVPQNELNREKKLYYILLFGITFPILHKMLNILYILYNILYILYFKYL